ncbi:hypothetical protein [Deinococcus sp. UYEF24]
MSPGLSVIANQNGVSKHTFARALKLKSINLDRSAAKFSQGFTLEANLRASRNAMQQIHDHLDARRDLAVETTLAGRHGRNMSSPVAG